MTSPKLDGPVLIFGAKTGWIGQQLVTLCKEKGYEVAVATSRLENKESVEKELDDLKPSRVLNAAGLTGRPNVDWCEDHKQDVIRVNLCGTILLADACKSRNIHMTNFATGCIFEYDAEHVIGGKGFTEEDEPNFAGSFYSETKGICERMLRHYDNVLTLRVRMPISDDLLHRNFTTKILNYAKVVDVPNSMTVLYDMLPASIKAAEQKLTGVLNFCNPGAISHNEVLSLYREHVDPDYKWENFTTEECRAILKAGRSNNTLDHTKFAKLFPEVPEIHDAVKASFIRMKKAIDEQGADALGQAGWKFPQRTLDNFAAKK